MTKTHKASLGLSIAAFVLFVVNQGFELAGSHVDFSGVLGAIVLTPFLAAGLVIQVAKLIEGHRSRADFILTMVQLVLHVVAEIVIWNRTQISNIGLPVELPLYIVGLYWVTGLADVFFRYIGRELKLFSGTYKSPEQLLLEQLDAQRVAQELLKEQLAKVETDRALLQHSLTTTQALVENARAEVEKRDKQLEKIREQEEKEKELLSQTYSLNCEVCNWNTGEKKSVDQAEYSLRAHMGRKHTGASVISPNGHKDEMAFSTSNN